MQKVTADMALYFLEHELDPTGSDKLHRLREKLGAARFDGLDIQGRISSAKSIPSIRRRDAEALKTIAMEFPEKRSNLADLMKTVWTDRSAFAEAIVMDPFNITELPGYDDRVKAIIDVFNYRSYWSRLWIVQELKLASDVTIICGHRNMNSAPFDVVQFAEDIAIRYSSNLAWKESSRMLYNELNPFTGALIKRKAPDSLASLVTEYSDRFCSEPKDAIYALLNVAAPIGIEPDYKETTVDTFIKSTKKMILQEQSFNVICNTVDWSYGKVLPPYLDLPSWVPHYESVVNTFSIYYYTMNIEKQHFCAGGLLKNARDLSLIRDVRVLQLSGSFYDTIKCTTPRVFSDEHDDADLVRIVMEHLHHVNQSEGSSQDFLTSESHINLEIWRFIFMDVYDGVKGVHERVSANTSARAFL